MELCAADGRKTHFQTVQSASAAGTRHDCRLPTCFALCTQLASQRKLISVSFLAKPLLWKGLGHASSAFGSIMFHPKEDACNSNVCFAPFPVRHSIERREKLERSLMYLALCRCSGKTQKFQRLTATWNCCFWLNCIHATFLRGFFDFRCFTEWSLSLQAKSVRFSDERTAAEERNTMPNMFITLFFRSMNLNRKIIALQFIQNYFFHLRMQDVAARNIFTSSKRHVLECTMCLWRTKREIDACIENGEEESFRVFI